MPRHPATHAADVLDLSLGRLGATTGALLGLAAVAIAWWSLTHRTGRPTVTAALAAGVAATALGTLVATTADGGLGTGNGLGGAYVAVLVGVIGTALSALALARSRGAGRRGSAR
ncbi:DUF6223 family protein [Streptomyces sp. NPDC020412]|uniref:DUF6223 family protein n=1 Tax=Streptomyces sp. NPDC020412 TaxID=3365073 RepID=UPI0037995BD6